MSQLDSVSAPRGVAVTRPKSNVYTVMLALSLVAILIAIIFLALEMGRYEWEIKPSGVAAAQAGAAGIRVGQAF